MNNNTTYHSMQDTGASFIGGFLFSVFGNASWIWSLQIINLSPKQAATFALAFALKLLATFMFGIIGGLAGILVREWHSNYKQWKKNKKK